MPESRARAARAAPRDPRMSLPGGWARAVDPSTNLPYYHNVARGITSWDPPGSPPGSAELVSAIARARVMAEFEAARGRGGRPGLDSGAGRLRRRGGTPLGTPSAPRDRDADVHPRGGAHPNAGESRVEPAKGREWGPATATSGGDAKRAKRGADERPPAPVEPQPGVGGSLGGDGEAAAVGMDGTGDRELGGVASK